MRRARYNLGTECVCLRTSWAVVANALSDDTQVNEESDLSETDAVQTEGVQVSSVPSNVFAGYEVAPATRFPGSLRVLLCVALSRVRIVPVDFVLYRV